MSPTSQSVVSPEDQSVTFVELFFDLVFVFSVTQIVALLHHEFTAFGAGQAILLFWLVWWAWTQFTWALNAADTTHPLVELGTLVATGLAFFMAVAVPDAFQDRGLWFALPYVLVRLVGLGLYVWVSSADPGQRAAVTTFGLLSLSGLAAVLVGGLAGGLWQYGFWGLAILLDILAANRGGRADSWNVHPEHFAERHGLFVIIALGETLIVAGAGLSGAEWSGGLIAVALLAVAITGALWWSYFPHLKPALERAMHQRRGAAQSMLARDVFSLLHFPMLGGVIAYAVAVEEAIVHPATPLPLAGRLALALGLFLFVGGASAAVRRATNRVLIPRLGITLVTSLVILFLPGVPPVVSLLIVLVGLLAVLAVEEREQIPAHGEVELQ